VTVSPRAIQHHTVGVSVEALASAWARRENVADGSVVIVDTEIAGRIRLGQPWLVDTANSVSVGMILRPDIQLVQMNLLWLVGSLAAHRAATACSESDLTIHWPDMVQVIGTNEPAVRVNVVTQLGPGRIEHAVVSLRFSLNGLGLASEARAPLVESAVLALDSSSSLLAEDHEQLIDAATEHTLLIGKQSKAVLLPRGEARGKAIAFDSEGLLVLKTATGMLELVAVDGLRQITTA